MQSTASVLPATAPEPDRLALQATGVEMRYSGTLALKGVDVQAEKGTIHALVGENGAGKSTFLGIIAGRVVPTRGTVRIFDQPHVFGVPRQARRLGIATIYQELTIVPALSAQANVFLGQVKSHSGLLDERAMRRRFEELAAEMSVSIRPDAIAGRLSVADQQMLEIMRGIQSGAKLLLFDEPTTSLAPPEREALFRLMRQLRGEGTTMMFVSHNLEEVLDLSDVVTVFRDGNLSGSAPRSEWTKPALIRAMVGHDVVENRRVERAPRKPGAAPLLMATGVTVPGAIENVDITVNPGEIVGIGGLVGSGRTSLLRALAGLEPRSTGTLSINGEAAKWPETPREALKSGIVLVPEDRKAQGLVLGMSAMDNIAIGRFDAVSRFGVISNSKMNQKSRAVAREFGFAENRVGTIVRNLSGGNQQKVMLGKARFRGPRILLVDEPTRGIDIGAKDEIMTTLRRLADDGLGIIVVSSDLEEVIAASDRILVMAEGQKVAELDQATQPAKVQDILNAAFKVMTHE
ncbi:ribose transport system ATP-binding protein/rhamnose transport system ATP-binding protein [Faunimonas pinastri]|uniref:Ribose transport system ATP-binding protein/rhamnose transport system ATP-binding protein n=1 Tax=Faunimonas pinastri TaxID=1855383 RepID=A0A1H9E0P5_9HYPH|nr:sugar ABC transporter ATP-binding protein [Faunimonas pinastri]SEQ19286.1 ribose transport system ATP-binding protein/rhamnose transport system ATP-binding protein [Faunimonas pinastri]